MVEATQAAQILSKYISCSNVARSLAHLGERVGWCLVPLSLVPGKELQAEGFQRDRLVEEALKQRPLH